MHIIVAFMKNGNGISYEVHKEEWERVRDERPLCDLMQFKTAKGSWVRLNLRETVAIEFQHQSGLVNPGKLPN